MRYHSREPGFKRQPGPFTSFSSGSVEQSGSGALDTISAAVLSICEAGNHMLNVYIDADGCPVKDEVYRVTGRHGLMVFVVSNAFMRVPQEHRIRQIVVGQAFDEADDWIVEHVDDNDIVITADIPLAARCLDKGAAVLGTKGRLFTEEMIGAALATRELMDQLRQSGEMTGGPAPMQKKDRSRFLSRLDNMIISIQRRLEESR